RANYTGLPPLDAAIRRMNMLDGPVALRGRLTTGRHEPGKIGRHWRSSMRGKAILVLAAISLVLLMACSGGSGHGATGPTSPGNVVMYSLSTSLTNNTGAATIVDAQIIVDKVVVYDSCPPSEEDPQLGPDGTILDFICDAPAVSRVPLMASGPINTGPHTLE